MSAKPPPQTFAQTGLADAILASGLVKSIDVIRRSEEPDVEAEPEPPKAKKFNVNRANSMMEAGKVNRMNLLKPQLIEDIMVDRQIHPLIPKLPPEYQSSYSKGEQLSDISFLHDRPVKQNITVSNESIAEEIPRNEKITFPRTVLAVQTIGKPQLASRANYEQLNNLLHQLTAEVESDLNLTVAEKIVAAKDSYDTVMTELVRQAYMECGSKGEILQSVREFMNQASDQIPVLNGKLSKIMEESDFKINSLKTKCDKLSEENQKLGSENSKLASKLDLSQQQLAFIEEKIPVMEKKCRTMHLNIQTLEKKNEKLTEEVGGLKKELLKSQNDLMTKTEVVESLGKELTEMKNLLSQKIKDYDSLFAEHLNLQRKFEEANIKIADLEQEIEDNRIHPPETKEVETQTIVYKKQATRNRPNLVNYGGISGTNGGSGSSIKLSREEIKNLKSDYDIAMAKLGGDCDLTLEQFNKLKEVILEQNKKFVGSIEQILEGEKGLFYLDGAHDESLRLFAHGLVDGIMNRACRLPSKTTKSIQTVKIPSYKVSIGTFVEPGNLNNQAFSDAFTRLLDPVYADRPPRTFDWILRSCRSIFDEKTLKDNIDISEKRSPSLMPQFALQWSTRQYGLSFLSHQCAWDLVISARTHQYKCTEVEMFRKFLDEDYSVQQLTFYLRLRSACLRRGITIPCRTKETNEPYNDQFLTSAQAVDLIQKIFSKTTKEFMETIITKLRENYVRKPSPTVDQTISYIQMSAVLEIGVEMFAKYDDLEMRKLVNIIRIVPKIDGKHFTALIKKLIPIATNNDIAQYHRLSTTNITTKSELSSRKFAEHFSQLSLLNPSVGSDLMQIDDIHKPTEEYKLAKERWGNLMPIMLKGVKKYEKMAIANPSVAHAISVLTIEIDNVNSSLTCYDVVGAHKHMLSCVLSYQTLMWTVKEPKPDIMDSITLNIRNMLKI